jgi:hypothetical protein
VAFLFLCMTESESSLSNEGMHKNKTILEEWFCYFKGSMKGTAAQAANPLIDKLIEPRLAFRAIVHCYFKGWRDLRC